jgi:ABC-type transport system involved in Fe-S cluster assembly fused permease/ATPase subunit
LDQGQIIEMGGHEDLIAIEGKYHALFMQQSLSNLWQHQS